MQPGFNSSPRVHVIRIVLTLAGIMIAGTVVRQVLLPDEFGKYGHYRPGAEADEAVALTGLQVVIFLCPADYSTGNQPGNLNHARRVLPENSVLVDSKGLT